MFLSKSEIILFAYVTLWTVAEGTESSNTGCNKPRCFVYLKRNASLVVSVSYSEHKKTTITTFCFNGLPKSLFHLWTNPVLHISKNEAFPNVSSRFITYYGTSVSDVQEKSRRQGYVVFQSLVNSLQPLKQTDDLALEPFTSSCYMIDTNIDYAAKVKIKVADLWFIAYMIAGIVLFFSANSWSHNTALHYSTGVSVGVIASVLILVFIISRLLPSKLKSLGYLLMFFGSSVSLWLLTTFSNIFTNPMAETFVENWQYVLGYIVTAGVLSFAIVYRYGPVTDERSLSLIQWFLQLVGLVLVYNSTQIREVSIALIIILLTIYNFPRRFLLNERSKRWWYRFFPPKIKLLTEEEYMIQGNIETKRELDKLRDYCRSPECQAWKMISKLKSPQRFAEFIMNGTCHVSESEMVEYDTQDDMGHSDPPSDTESELIFVLGSPSRTVHASLTRDC